MYQKIILAYDGPLESQQALLNTKGLIEHSPCSVLVVIIN
jgi:hypothetical protein